MRENRYIINPETDNLNRNRSYGLRVGDLVFTHKFNGAISKLATVIDRTPDNNRVVLKLENGEEIREVAEWCTPYIYVENIKTIESYKEKYGVDVYDEIENEYFSNKKSRVDLLEKAKRILSGTVLHLWLPKDKESKRNQNLWFVQWHQSNKCGIVEEKDLVESFI